MDIDNLLYILYLNGFLSIIIQRHPGSSVTHELPTEQERWPDLSEATL
jgi:hypothetical protein